jgi:hypothetical protein
VHGVAEPGPAAAHPRGGVDQGDLLRVGHGAHGAVRGLVGADEGGVLEAHELVVDQLALLLPVLRGDQERLRHEHGGGAGVAREVDEGGERERELPDLLGREGVAQRALREPPLGSELAVPAQEADAQVAVEVRVRGERVDAPLRPQQRLPEAQRADLAQHRGRIAEVFEVVPAVREQHVVRAEPVALREQEPDGVEARVARDPRVDHVGGDPGPGERALDAGGPVPALVLVDVEDRRAAVDEDPHGSLRLPPVEVLAPIALGVDAVVEAAPRVDLERGRGEGVARDGALDVAQRALAGGRRVALERVRRQEDPQRELERAEAENRRAEHQDPRVRAPRRFHR